MCVNGNLSIIAKDHKKWVKIVRSLGESNYAEDIVQDCYLKIDRLNYYERIIDEGKVSISYMYMLLRSGTNDYHNRNKKETINFNIDDCKLVVTDSFNNDKENAYLAICENVDKEIDAWGWYDREIFKIYRMHWKDKETLNRLLEEFNGKVSIRKIAKNTNISITTLFHGLKESKKIIKEKFLEDWEDYKNEEYHLITKQ